MPETKSFQRFRARLDSLRQHVEVVDAALEATTKELAGGSLGHGPMEDGDAVALSDALGHASGTYPRLDKLPAHKWRPNFHQFSKQLNYEYGITLLYPYFEEYVKDMTDQLPVDASRYSQDAYSDLQIDAPKVIPYLSTVAKINSEVGALIVGKVRAKKYGRGMAQKIEDLCDLRVSKKNKRLAHMVLDVRNAFVHSGGMMSKELNESHGRVLEQELGAVEGRKITLTLPFVSNGVERIRAYVGDLDSCLVSGGWVAARK